MQAPPRKVVTSEERAGPQPGDVAALRVPVLVDDPQRQDAEVGLVEEAVGGATQRLVADQPAVVVVEEHEVAAHTTPADVPSCGDADVVGQVDHRDVVRHGTDRAARTVGHDEELDVDAPLCPDRVHGALQLHGAVAHGQQDRADAPAHRRRSDDRIMIG
jgi:hypothetical protein